MFDDCPPAALGPVRIRKRLERLSATHSGTRQQAIIDLGYATPTDAIKAAVRPFLEDANRYLRWAAAQALGRLGDVSAVPRLVDMVRHDPDRHTAVHAAFALARMDHAVAPAVRSRVRDVIAERRERAVGHDRAALSELLRRMARL